MLNSQIHFFKFKCYIFIDVIKNETQKYAPSYLFLNLLNLKLENKWEVVDVDLNLAEKL